jgi:hypothetical protein
VNAWGDAIGLDPRSTARTIGQQRSRSSAARTAQRFADKGSTRLRARLDAVVSAETYETTALDEQRSSQLPLTWLLLSVVWERPGHLSADAQPGRSVGVPPAGRTGPLIRIAVVVARPDGALAVIRCQRVGAHGAGVARCLRRVEASEWRDALDRGVALVLRPFDRRALHRRAIVGEARLVWRRAGPPSPKPAGIPRKPRATGRGRWLRKSLQVAPIVLVLVGP